jgi:hypothetical protein
LLLVGAGVFKAIKLVTTLLLVPVLLVLLVLLPVTQ